MMTQRDYEISREIAMHDIPFYGIIMTAMRRADTDNLTKLRLAFPKVWMELEARYNAPGGVLESDPGYQKYIESMRKVSEVLDK